MKDKDIDLKGAIDREAIAEIFAEIALEAAVAVMAVYAGDIQARHKADGSPVCDADEAAEAIILNAWRCDCRLTRCLPRKPRRGAENWPRNAAFILVDPVDGTREFLSRNGEFTINIGLIVDAAPVAGVVYAPALEQLWIGGITASACTVAPGAPLPPAAKRQVIHARPAPEQGLTALVSRSHADPATEAFLAKLPIRERREAGSSLKFCKVAEGYADVYPRIRPDHGVGHGGGGRGVAGGGRDRSRWRRAPHAVRKSRSAFSTKCLLSLGATPGPPFFEPSGLASRDALGQGAQLRPEKATIIPRHVNSSLMLFAQNLDADHAERFRA